MRWFIDALMPEGKARPRYDKLVNMLREAWRFTAEPERWEISPYLERDPFSQWYPDAFGAEVHAASDPLNKGGELFAIRILDRLSAGRNAVEAAATFDFMEQELYKQILDPDNTLPGNGTPWQESYWWLRDHMINSPAARHAVPWSRLGLYLLGYGGQPYYSFLKPIGRKRQESVRAKIRSDGDYRYEWLAREALETIGSVEYWETLVQQDEAPSALSCSQHVSPGTLDAEVGPTSTAGVGPGDTTAPVMPNTASDSNTPLAGAKPTEQGETAVLINEENRTVTVGGQITPLTPYQFRVVKRLVEAGGGIVAGEDLKQYSGSNEDIRSIIKRLPPAIRDKIGSKRGQYGGYWLKL